MSYILFDSKNGKRQANLTLKKYEGQIWPKSNLALSGKCEHHKGVYDNHPTYTSSSLCYRDNQ